jgi:LDH2 family malate/lactate/ureidoglycolate dehydrogenase
MRIDAFRPADEFKNHMDNWIERFRKAQPVSGKEKVLIPGDPEREMEIVRVKEGIPLNKKVEEDLRELGKKLAIDF